MSLTDLLAGFQDYLKAERRLSPKTIKDYVEAVIFFRKLVGDIPAEELQAAHFIAFKSRMLTRGAGASRIASIINAMKSFLVYNRVVGGLTVLDTSLIKCPKVPRREVIYLTPEEIIQFTDAIRLQDWTGRPRPSGYLLRALVEMLLATGMRISEALSLNRDSVNRFHKEAVIIGKGNKERTVFFTNEAINWIDQYLALRTDTNPALFVSLRCTRLSVDSVEPMFRRLRKSAGLKKHVTPHVLRHTTATTLLRNGCPIGFIKEILGHTDLMITCRYYLGIMDKTETKRAHTKFLYVHQDQIPAAPGEDQPLGTSLEGPIVHDIPTIDI